MRISTGHNTGLAKIVLQFSADTFVVNQTLVFQIKFCGKSPALRVAVKSMPHPMNDRKQTDRQR